MRVQESTSNLLKDTNMISIEKEISDLRDENQLLKKELNKMKLLECELAYLRHVDSTNKTLIIQLIENQVSVPVKNAVEENSEWTFPKHAAKPKKVVSDYQKTVPVRNRYTPLSYGINNNIMENETSSAESNVIPANPDTIYTDSAPLDGTNIDAVLVRKHKQHGIIIDQKPENNVVRSWRNKYPQTVPGNSSFSKITQHGKNILVAGDSMIKWVKGKVLSEDLHHGKAFVKAFTGATAKELKDYYIQPLLKKGGIDSVVIMVGTNNIPVQKTWVDGMQIKTEQSNLEIAEEIIEVADECKRKGVNDVFINGIVHRHGFNKKINQVNKLVEAKCKDRGYVFISNDFIGDNFIADGLHFNHNGTIAYTSNLISSINYHYDNQ